MLRWPGRPTGRPRHFTPRRSSTRSSSRRRASPCHDPALMAWTAPRTIGAWEDRRQVASFLGLPEAAVRVSQVSTGGAFGGKEDLNNVQGQAALLALLSLIHISEPTRL